MRALLVAGILLLAGSALATTEPTQVGGSASCRVAFIGPTVDGCTVHQATAIPGTCARGQICNLNLRIQGVAFDLPPGFQELRVRLDGPPLAFWASESMPANVCQSSGVRTGRVIACTAESNLFFIPPEECTRFTLTTTASSGLAVGARVETPFEICEIGILT